MALSDLLQLLPVPTNPRWAGARSGEDWLKIEGKIGTPLPQDYKDFINTYGSGRIGGFVLVLNPFAAEPSLNLRIVIPEITDNLRLLRQRHGERQYPYLVYPELGGLLPWGVTDNGDELFWQTSTSPEQWSIVIKMSREPEFEHHLGPMTSFIVGLITGTVTSEIIPYEAIDQTALFAIVH